MAGVASFDDGVPIWTGGDTVVVQLGDILDRGDAEIATFMLFRHLARQAEREGGAIHILNGNHESLNVCGDFRCVPKLIAAYRMQAAWTCALAGVPSCHVCIILHQPFRRSASGVSVVFKVELLGVSAVQERAAVRPLTMIACVHPLFLLALCAGQIALH